MLEYTVLFLSQIGVNIFKTHEIVFTAQREVKKVIINSVFLALTLLFSFYISIDGLFQGDYFILVVYIIGAMLGKHIALEQALYTKFFRKIFYTVFSKITQKVK